MLDKTEEKRQRLFETTRDMILANGIQGASMSKISKKAQLPMGTIYAMYPAKEDLINATYVFCRNNYMKDVDFVQCLRAGDSKAVVIAAVQAYMDAALAHDKDFMFVEQCYLDPIISPDVLSDGNEVLSGFGLQSDKENNDNTKNVYLIKQMALTVLHKAIVLDLTGHIELNDIQRKLVAKTCWDILSALWI